jgi:limonene-1,2-epoxide hydrolase
MKTEKNEAPTGIANPESLVQTVVTALREGQIDTAVNQFGEQFAFNDYGMGLEFRDKARLTQFFRETRALYPDTLVLIDGIFVSGNHVISEWTLRYSLTERLFGEYSRELPICVHGVSVVRIENGKIADWSDYYDRLTSRRTALTSCFTEWIDL